jgi:hypothetical protein
MAQPSGNRIAPTCDLSILVSRIDTRFMLQTVAHIVRACGYPFTRRVLVVDTAPLGRRYARRPNIGSPEDLRRCCRELVAAGLIDDIAPIDYSPEFHRRMYRKHFAGLTRQTHSSGGYPILGSIFAIEESRADYLVHFDSDIMLYQAPGYSWIEEGIKLLCEHSDLLAVLPRSGPPAPDDRLRQQEERGESYERDPRGLFAFQTFTSRVFLIDRKRFERVLPLRSRLPLLQVVRNYFTRHNTMPEWETMVGYRLPEVGMIRADLATRRAWTLHPDDRGDRFEQALPSILERIEAGEYPPEQGGRYDLVLDRWL